MSRFGPYWRVPGQEMVRDLGTGLHGQSGGIHMVRRHTALLGLASLAVGAALVAAPAQAGVFGKLKKKAETTVTKETDQAVDDAVEKKPVNA